MRKIIHINCLLKDNKIIAWHIGPNKRTTPSDYYKDFFYADVSMENCDKEYEVKYMSVEFEENDDSNNFNDYVFKDISRKFYWNWEIHPNHWGSRAYPNAVDEHRKFLDMVFGVKGDE